MNNQPKLSSAHMPAPVRVPATTPSDREVRDVLRPPNLPAAAAPPALDRPRRPRIPRQPDRPDRPGPPDRPSRAALGNVYLVTLLSTVDGSLLLLATTGRLSSLGSSIAVGLTIIAGAGSWLAARQAFAGRRPRRRDLAALATLGAVTVAATVASVWLGTTLAKGVTLHVMPKAAGIVLFLVAADVAGLRVPRVRGLPLAVVAIGASALLEVAVRWIPS